MKHKRSVLNEGQLWKVCGRLLLLLWLLPGCSLLPELPDLSALPWPLSSTPTPTATPPPEQSPTPLPPETPSVTPTTPAEDLVLDLWVPGFLYGDVESRAAQTLSQQIDSYVRTRPNTHVRISAKKNTGEGGILSLISTAIDVAPSIVPDVVVLNQHDLLVAADAGLLQPLDEALLSDAGYFPAALSAVTTTQGLWAFPYVAQAEQMAYAVGITDTPPLSWTAVLSGSYQMLFPAGPPEGVATDALLAMYQGAGGRTTDQAGQPTLDRTTLERLYGFFMEMREAGLLDAETTLGLTDASASWARYQEGVGQLTPVPVGVFWALPEPAESDADAEDAESARRDSAPSWVPTPDGAPVVILHTWGLAILTDDPVRLEVALGLVEWLVGAQQLGELTRAAGLVPTRQPAIRMWSLQTDELAFMDRLLLSGVRACPPSIDLPVRRALQAGLSALLLQEVASPEQAASHALTNLRR